MYSQVDTVIMAVDAVLEEAGVKVAGSKAEALTDGMRKQVVEMVTASILAGETVFSDEAKAKYPTPERVKTYVTGMVSNHLKKCAKLNGGTKYQPKNPGSKAGSSDPVIKELRVLLSVAQDDENRDIIQQEIESRKAELAAAKAPQINWDLIPEHLKTKLAAK